MFEFESEKPCDPDEVARELGFASMVDYKLAEESVGEISAGLQSLLAANPPARDLALNSALQTAIDWWHEHGPASMEDLPVVQVARDAGGAPEVRFAYMADKPMHSLELVFRAEGVMLHRLFLQGRCQSYEGMGEKPRNTEQLLQRYRLGKKHNNVWGLPLGRRYSYDNLSVELGFANIMQSAKLVLRSRQEIGDGLANLLERNPLFGKDSDMNRVARHAASFWESYGSWQGQVPAVHIADCCAGGTGKGVLFLYHRLAPEHSFSYLIGSGVPDSYCLVLNGRVVSFDARHRPPDVLSRFERFVRVL